MHSALVADIGEVLIKKSARAKRMILRFNDTGHPVVTIPRYAPYRLGQQFAQEHRAWILQHRPDHTSAQLTTRQPIGRDHLLLFEADDLTTPKSRVTDGRIIIRYPRQAPITDAAVQAEALKAIKRAIKRQAQQYLLPRLEELARQHGRSYREGRIKLLRSRWGSCTRRQQITLNAWLVQLPDELVDYVICHELAHLDHPHHQVEFWRDVEAMVPNYKNIRKKLRLTSPQLAEHRNISFT